MAPNAIIFDRDGVLTHFDVARAQDFFAPLLPFSVFELGKRWQQWGGKVGFPTTLEEERIFFAGFWQHLGDEFALDDDQLRALDACRYTDFIKPYPEVKEVLRTLKSRGIPIGVLSNFSLASLDASLAATGLLEWVDITCPAAVIGYSKPEPAAYLHVARLLNQPPEACWFFDDEPPCVAGAHAVGMIAYLVDRQQDDADPSNRTIHNLTDVLEIAF